MVSGKVAMMAARPRSADPAPLRISYLFPQFPVDTEVFAVSDIDALRRQGHEVRVHTIKPARSDEMARLRLAGVPTDIAIRRPSLTGALRWPGLLWKHRRVLASLIGRIAGQIDSAPANALTALLSLPRIAEVAEEVAAFDADIVHVFWSRHPGMVLPVLAGSGSRALRSTFVGAYDLVADDFLVEISLAWSELAFTHAETNRSFLEARAPEGIPISVIHRGIPLMDRDATIHRDPDLWLTASALAPAKNVGAVLQAFASARAGAPRLRLEICGDGPDRARLEQLCCDLGCAETVTFRGHIGREELFRHMQRAKLFLLLSKKPTERLPNVIKEALWAGCAVVSSRSEGIEELLPDSSIGGIVDPDDGHAIAQAINAAMKESEDATRERQARARNLIADLFSSDSSMSDYVSAWRAGLESRAIEGSVVRGSSSVRASAASGRGQEMAHDG
jgi:glycosyltransferase involved in cell wall biosynthesis